MFIPYNKNDEKLSEKYYRRENMYDKLFTPMKIAGCEIPNRLFVPAMVSNICKPNGEATERYIAYHEEKAKGGWGLIITEDYPVNRHAMGYNATAGLYDESTIESHKRLTDTIHKYDTKIFCQIYHAGRQSGSFVNGGVQPVAPSQIPCSLMRQMPKELTIDEIHEIINDFAVTAARAVEAGFDGIEIHGAHGYLIGEFLSPYTNKRVDEYGGCFYNRTRFLREIYQVVREAVGADFPVTFRYNMHDGYPGGLTIAEGRMIARMCEEMGVNALNLSASMYGNHNTYCGGTTMYSPHGELVDMAKEIKRIVNIPVMCANRLNDVHMADSLVSTGAFDFVGMARGSLADPHFPEKAKAGKFQSIRHCLGCMQGCIPGIVSGSNIACLVNPELTYEGVVDYSKVKEAKKIFIAGSGPGGMETAIVAARRGHNVTLFEAQDVLGGQFLSAAYPPSKGIIASFTAWQIHEMKEQGVEVRLSTALTKEIVLGEKPDHVVIATGGSPVVPNIPGIHKEFVHTAEETLLGRYQTGDNIVVCGGGEVGAETAAHLALQERKITVVEMLPELMMDMAEIPKNKLYDIFAEYKVKSYTSAKVVGIADEHVIIEQFGKQLALATDNVVLAMGYRPNNALAEELKGICEDIFVIGGAVKTSNAMIAIKEGFDLGLKL